MSFVTKNSLSIVKHPYFYPFLLDSLEWGDITYTHNGTTSSGDIHATNIVTLS